MVCSIVWRLTTAFFGFACSWDISSSCSGVHTRTLLSTLNQPLHRKPSSVSESVQIQEKIVRSRFLFLPTLHPRVTRQTPDRFSHLWQCSARSLSHDCPRSPCEEANSAHVSLSEVGCRLESRDEAERNFIFILLRCFVGNLTWQLGCRWFPSASPRCRCRSTSACCPSGQTSAFSSFYSSKRGKLKQRSEQSSVNILKYSAYTLSLL